MKFTVITLFPEFVENLKDYSIIGRAIKTKKISLKTINLRDFGLGKHHQVDDKPYGGGAGMLLRVDVATDALKMAGKTRARNKRVILLSADGDQFDQKTALRYSKLDELILFCGHYEGHDRRIEDYVDEKISVGKYVLTGGELPAMTIIDAVSRLIEGVIKSRSLKEESFSASSPKSYDLRPKTSFIESPQYTRPEVFEDKKVPEVLLSGDPKKIEEWKEKYTGRRS